MKHTEYLKYTFTDEEARDHARALARNNAERTRLEQQKKEIDSSLKAQIEERSSNIGRLSDFINNGYESFGGPVLMRVDTPELPEREYVLDKPAYVDVDGDGGQRWTPAGAKVKRPATPGTTVYVGVGSIYRLVPCTEAAAMAAIEAAQARTPILLELPPGMALAAASDSFDTDSGDEPEDDDVPY